MEKAVMENFDFLRQKLAELEKANLLRKPMCVESAQGPVVSTGGREFTVFCSNNYLSLADSPEIISAVCDSIKEYGFGSCASRLVSGTMGIHIETEKALAKFFGKEAALLFPSGWSANEGVISALVGPEDTVFMDKLDHASIIDAVKNTRAKFHTFRKGGLDRLEKMLDEPCRGRKYIITESIFSMDGDCADLKKIAELKERFGAILIVDEAHAAGCLGKTGAGLAEQIGALDKVDILVATLTKALE
jgi:7-keto-8-aminopelargonate synthetase-like enzyme